jgi:type IV pilus assembly protein PilX
MEAAHMPAFSLPRPSRANGGRRKTRSQRGFSLFVAMIFLLVLSLLAVTVVRSVITHERMAGNTQDWNLAFQSAEAALKDGQADVFARATDPALSTAYAAAGCGAGATAGLCLPAEDGTPIWTHMVSDDPCWTDGKGTCTVSLTYGSKTGNPALTNNANAKLTAQPRYVIENLGPVAPGSSKTDGYEKNNIPPKYAYRVTAVGFGNIRTAADVPAIRVMLQSVVQN